MGRCWYSWVSQVRAVFHLFLSLLVILTYWADGEVGRFPKLPVCGRLGEAGTGRRCSGRGAQHHLHGAVLGSFAKEKPTVIKGDVFLVGATLGVEEELCARNPNFSQGGKYSLLTAIAFLLPG